MHTEETEIYIKIYITVYKNSFGEEVHVSPEEQTKIVFVPILKEKHQRLIVKKKKQQPPVNFSFLYKGYGALKISILGFQKGMLTEVTQ